MSALGLDIARWETDLTSAAVLQRVRRDVEGGLASGEVVGTPTVFIDGVVYEGDHDVAALLAALAR